MGCGKSSPAAAEDDTVEYKVVVIGESGVGKTSLICKYADPNFVVSPDNKNEPSPPVNKTLKINETSVNLEIHDTAGEERYRSVTSSTFRGASAVLVVFDVSSTKTFEASKTWIEEARRYAGSKVTLLLIGNKTDIVQREVDTKTAEEFASGLSVDYHEASALKGENVSEVFVRLGTMAHERLG